MDKNAMVTAGHALVRALDESQVEISVAIWIHSTDADSWKLWVSPKVTNFDKRLFYAKVVGCIAAQPDLYTGLTAADVELVNAGHQVIVGLKNTINAPGFVNATLSNNDNLMNGYYLPDGILLRSQA